MKNKRFEVISYENNGLCISYEVIVDKITGVNYLYVKNGYSGGLTPLLDEKGKVIISKGE